MPFPPRSAEEHRLATTGGSFIPPFRTPLRRGRLEEDAAVHDGKSCFPPTEPGAGESRFCSEPCADTDGHRTSCLFSSHSSYPLLPPQDWGLGALGVSHSSSSFRILRPPTPHHDTHSTRPRPRADFPCPGPDAGSPASTSRAGASSREHGQPGQGSRPQLFCHLVAMLSIAPLNAPIACVLMTLLKSLQKSPNNDQLLPAADADAATLNSGGFTGQGGGPGPSV